MRISMILSGLMFILNLSGQMVLFEGGRSDWRIVIPADPLPAEQMAADELQGVIEKISGIKLPVVKGEPHGKNNIIIGTGDTSSAIKALNIPSSASESIVLVTRDGNLYLGGNLPRAAYFAVQEFLQTHLGARWFWPGDDGEFLPSLKSFAIPVLDYRYTTPFRSRELTPCFMPRHQPTQQWIVRNFLNDGIRKGEIRDQVQTTRVGWGHSVCVDQRNFPFEKYPDLYCMIDGKRSQAGNAGCWSNPDFVRNVVERHIALFRRENLEIYRLGTADNMRRCDCPECSKNPDRSSRWYNLISLLAREIRKELPDAKFATIAYQEYIKPPLDGVRDLEYVEYCQYDRCYIHMLGDPDCKLNAESLKKIREWQKHAAIGIFGYEFDAFSTNEYLPFWQMISDMAREFRKMGIIRVKTEMVTDWNPKKYPSRELLPAIRNRLAYYLYARLLWNPDLDVEVLIDDFCERVYGPAAKPMREYHRVMGKAWLDIKGHLSYCLHSPVGTSRLLISPELIEQGRALLTEAEKAAGEARLRADIAVDRTGFESWVKVYNSSKTAATINVPQGKENAIKVPMASSDKNFQPTELSIYRTADALHFSIDCQEKDMKNFNPGPTGRDMNNFGTNSIEIFLEYNDSTPYRHFVFTPAGGKYDARGTDASWDAQWDLHIERKADRWTAEVTLPYAGIERKPGNNEAWNFVVVRNRDRVRGGYPRAVYHSPSSGAVLFFSDKAEPGKRLLFLSQKEGDFGMGGMFLEDGWNYSDILESDLADTDTSGYPMIFWHARKTQITPDIFRRKLLPQVKAGAVLWIQNAAIPLDKYFDDPSFAIKNGSQVPLHKERKAFWNEKSRFYTHPNPMANVFRSTPGTLYTPVEPDKWEVFVSQKLSDGSMVPFMLGRPCGKGFVILSGPVWYARKAIPYMFTNGLKFNSK